jgi:gamma-tubulin complex component 3
LLYKSLQGFIATEETLGDDNVGLVGQSLRGAVKGELSGWMNLVAGIESEIRRFLASKEMSGVTLKRVAIWVREGTLGLRLMSVIIEDTNGTSPPPPYTHAPTPSLPPPS